MNTHYDVDYFNWQRQIGELTGAANQFLYRQYIAPEDAVLDFGCGGGYLLAGMNCRRKLAVELNPHAAEVARTNGLVVFADLGEVAEKVDVIISSHALEHTHDPLGVLKQMTKVLKPGGKLVLVTPYERNMPWKAGDINQHLFTWSPMNLGNLATTAGFKVLSCEVVYHRFPPKSMFWRRVFGLGVLHAMACVWGRIYGKVRQVRVVATI